MKTIKKTCNIDTRSVYAYIRESTKEQAEKGYNLEMQRKRCQEYSTFMGFENIEIIVEKGKSARTTDRKELNKLKELIKENKVGKVIVYKLDRLVRRLSGLHELLELFMQYDVELISICESIDTSTATGRMFVNFVVMMAEWEEDTISERTIDGLVEGAEQQYYVKGNFAPMGYNRIPLGDHYILKGNIEERRIIRKACEMLKSGYSSYLIRLMINSDPYMVQNKKTMAQHTIDNMLRNKILMGVMNLQGKDYKIKVDQTVLTADEFLELEKILNDRKKESKYNYLFANKIRSTQGNALRKECTIKKSGPVLYYYDRYLKKRMNEKIIREAVIHHLGINQTLYTYYRKRTYEHDLQLLESKRKHIMLAYDQAYITTEMYNQELLELDNERNIIEESKIKYIECLPAYFNDLSFNKQEELIWKTIKWIEVDINLKKVVKVC